MDKTPICERFMHFMNKQMHSLHDAVAKEKWYMSQQAGYDVGLDAAQEHYFEDHLNDFAHHFRISYCGGECPERERCALAPHVASMPSIEEISQTVRTAEDDADAASA